jgi:hypothetical protein
MALKLFFILFLLTGCYDSSMSHVYDKRILDNDIKCMRLLVFPPNKTIQDTLESLYDFSTECKLDFIVSYKNSVTCNSNQNSDKKAYGMPSAYLRYELKQNNKLFYSYYIDLDEQISSDDIKDGFAKMQNQLNFKRESR